MAYGEKVGPGGTMAFVAKALMDAYFQDILEGNQIPGENEMK